MLLRWTWFLSVNRLDLPQDDEQGKAGAFRSIVVDGKEIDFSGGMEDLHTRSYEEILKGKGFTLEENRASIDIVQRIRGQSVDPAMGELHPAAKSILEKGVIYG